MISKQRKQEIISAFQRSLKRDNSAEIEKFTLEELQDADTMLGPRDLNSPYRIAIKNRIAELAATAVSQSESSTTSMEEHNTRVDRFIARVKNHPILSGILIIGIVFLALTRITESGRFWLDLFRPNSSSITTVPLNTSDNLADVSVLPAEINANIKSVSPFQQDAIAKSYAGLEVSWQVYFDGVSVNNGLVFFRHKPKSLSAIIYCTVDFDNHPFLKIAQVEDAVSVHGFIIQANGSTIELDDCTFDK